MDLRQLRYFLAVAEERSVTRAAARLHLTQPPLSAQLARLEHELGVPLLIRHRRGVDLTEAGRHLLAHARRLLADVDAAADSVRRLGEGRSGRMALAFVSATAWSVLPPLLRRYHDERPDVVLDFLEDGPDGVLEHVRARRADLGLLHLPPPGAGARPEPDLDVAVVQREPLVAVLPRALASRFAERVDLAELAGEVFLSPARAGWGGLASHLLNACRSAGVEPVLREVALAHTVVSLVAAGLGVSVLPASARLVCGPQVVALPLSRPVPVVETALLRRRADAPSPLVAHFLRLALATPEPDVLGPAVARPRSGA
ncbi:LysR family transcriptional regulator [Pseudonocardia bannensis]|uniref:LysR family transcriptional regulator n=1 Tax=Pseudonocardia bannensis TaxID=630973 RepID=A0A848DH87_9PSEU|nr:LysR substrate-binding domain-containing protein [Pseudonocardia bannensis]NMH91874.1 LysR family transcriptional regulator [Pseudonocardia bannensis]